MKLEQAVQQTIDEDAFYELAADAFEVYQAQGGTVLNIDEYLKLFKKNIQPWHVAKKEKEFKEKFKKSKDFIKQKLYNYFFNKKAA